MGVLVFKESNLAIAVDNGTQIIRGRANENGLGYWCQADTMHRHFHVVHLSSGRAIGKPLFSSQQAEAFIAEIYCLVDCLVEEEDLAAWLREIAGDIERAWKKAIEEHQISVDTALSTLYNLADSIRQGMAQESSPADLEEVAALLQYLSLPKQRETKPTKRPRN